MASTTETSTSIPHIIDDEPRGNTGQEPAGERCLSLDTVIDGSNRLKEEGNGYFRQSRWTEAHDFYRLALRELPDRKGKGGDEVESNSQKKPKPLETTELDRCAMARAVLHGNIAACHFRQSNYSEAAKACTESLLDDPDYHKVLRRRADCNEKLGTWSSLTQAQTDLKHLLDLIPSADPSWSEVTRQLRRIEPQLSSAQKRETDEMMGKLKELGNDVLGNFGLSTDNFKMEPNGQGGYSMQFQR